MSIHDRKTKREEQKRPWVSPCNRMPLPNKEDISGTVIEMSDTSRLLFIFGGPLVFETPLGDSNLDFMASAIYNTKKKKIYLKGRMRYEDTGRKTTFEFKDQFTLKEIEKAKAKIREMFAEMLKGTPFTKAKDPFELSFEVDEDMDSIIKKMNDSNQFNIGIGSK